MLEFFKGTGSVGKVAKRMGFDVFSLDIDPNAKPDLVANILDVDASKLPVPDYVWASPPCNTYSSLVYPLKERNPKTAEPYSDRAKEGTAILYKTLSIINALLEKNPKLYYCIENPHGMMRKDQQMTALPYMTTTLYCMYGDGKQKRTDFWSNYPLTLKEGTCGAKTPVQNGGLTLNERYRMPPALIRDILKQIPKGHPKDDNGGDP
jgi:hypothetical protein